LPENQKLEAELEAFLPKLDKKSSNENIVATQIDSENSDHLNKRNSQSLIERSLSKNLEKKLSFKN